MSSRRRERRPHRRRRAPIISGITGTQGPTRWRGDVTPEPSVQPGSCWHSRKALLTAAWATGAAVQGKTQLQPGTWYHIAVVYDADREAVRAMMQSSAICRADSLN